MRRVCLVAWLCAVRASPLTVCVCTRPTAHPSEFSAQLLLCFPSRVLQRQQNPRLTGLSADQMSSEQRLGPDTFCRGAGQAWKAQRGNLEGWGACHDSRCDWDWHGFGLGPVGRTLLFGGCVSTQDLGTLPYTAARERRVVLWMSEWMSS